MLVSARGVRMAERTERRTRWPNIWLQETRDHVCFVAASNVCPCWKPNAVFTGLVCYLHRTLKFVLLFKTKTKNHSLERNLRKLPIMYVVDVKLFQPGVNFCASPFTGIV